MPLKQKRRQIMGQLPNKYHISDDGSVNKINDDGSFTYVGNIEELPLGTTINKSGPPPIPGFKDEQDASNNKGRGRRNYSWLWVTTLVVFIGWFISCLSCAWPEYPQFNEFGEISGWYYRDNTSYILAICAAILSCYGLSWFLSLKDNIILKLTQIPIVGCVS